MLTSLMLRVACLAAAVIAGVDNIHIKPGAKVLYLGAASGTSVSHVSDIVGPQGAVYAVEFSHRSGDCADGDGDGGKMLRCHAGADAEHDSGTFADVSIGKACILPAPPEPASCSFVLHQAA